MCPFLEPRMESIPTAQGVGKRSSPQYNWELITEDWTKNRAGKKKKKVKLKCKQTRGLLHMVTNNTRMENDS